MVVVKEFDADPTNEVEQDCSDVMNLEVMGWWRVASVCADNDTESSRGDNSSKLLTATM